VAQTKKAFDEVRIPFSKMTFSPDVPSTALGPNEYNAGQNVECDVRGIRSVAGDEIILPTKPVVVPAVVTIAAPDFCKVNVVLPLVAEIS